MEDCPVPRPVGIRDRDRREECLRIWVKRVRVQPVPFRDLHNPSQVHDSNPVADVFDNGEVVCNE